MKKVERGKVHRGRAGSNHQKSCKTLDRLARRHGKSQEIGPVSYKRVKARKQLNPDFSWPELSLLMKAIVIGGAGFIGSCCAERLLADPGTQVTVFDNFSSGRRWHLEPLQATGRLRIVFGDARDPGALTDAMAGHDLLFHFASNPDIARAATEPTIDFQQGTLLSQNIFEAARLAGVARVIYASGSGVFGDHPERIFDEDDFSPCPTSTYAASKAAGETLLSAYCAMFGLRGLSYRFANVVGPHQTHGVAFDFIRRLRQNPNQLTVMGNGRQTKPYIHVDDIVSALLLFRNHFVQRYDYFNLSTDDSLTVEQIAQLVIGEMGLRDVDIRFGTSDRGWAGDVPRIRFTAEKMKSHGWTPRRNSAEAMRASIRGMLANADRGIFA
jgi:UDP-glucose 4-epimerase